MRSAAFGTGDFVLVAEPDDAVSRQPDALEQVIEHHDAPERRRQRRDQHAVVATRQHAGDGARRVAAEAVGHQPLAPRRALAGRDGLVFAIRGASECCEPDPSSLSGLRHEKHGAAAGHEPGTVGIERRHPLAAVLRRLAAPRQPPARVERRRQQRLPRRREIEIALRGSRPADDRRARHRCSAGGTPRTERRAPSGRYVPARASTGSVRRSASRSRCSA